ncbi:MAG: hypothetical protein WBN39_11055, partial [Flavobacteriaceae bacterium]
MKTAILALLLIICATSLEAQDTIPPPREIDSMAMDTTVVDTVVIRRLQERIKDIKRGVTLNTSVISFKKTKPLDKEFNRFQVPSFWQGINLF